MIGINNEGFTCYMNTLMQCLATVKDIVPSLTSAVHEQNPDPVNNQFTVLVSEALTKIKRSTKDDTSKPMSIRQVLMCSQHTFKMNMFTQHDLHEILMLIVTKIHDDTGSNVPKIIGEPAGNSKLDKLSAICRKNFYRDNEWKSSFVSRSLYGQIVKQIVCGSCGHAHHNYETFITLNLDIHNNSDTETVETTITDFMKHRMLTDWKCDKCNVVCPSEQRTYIWHLPKTLIICIKRFEASPDYTSMKKNKKMVEVPINLTIDKEYVLNPTLEPDQLRQYELSSIGVHLGSMNNGHYLAYVRDETNNKWYMVDDDIVRDVDLPEEITEKKTNHLQLDNAYILVYNLS